MSSCQLEAQHFGWRTLCKTENALCGSCAQCAEIKTIVCPDGWFSNDGKCYIIHQSKYNFAGAKEWCQAHGAELVSINSEKENHFVWRLCGTGTDNPLAHQLVLKRGTCWIGLTEKAGNKNTRQDQQNWAWADGTSTQKYAKWAQSKDGSMFDEPSNARSSTSMAGSDERHAALNDRADGFAGTWYDRPSSFEAYPVCEMEGKAADAVVKHDALANKGAFPSLKIVPHAGRSLRGSPMVMAP